MRWHYDHVAGLVKLAGPNRNSTQHNSDWPTRPKTIRRLALTVPPFWFSYNAITGSFAGMFVELILLFSNLIGQYRFDISPKRATTIAKK